MNFDFLEPPAPGIMQSYDPGLTRRMLNELSPSTTSATGRMARRACQDYVPEVTR